MSGEGRREVPGPLAVLRAADPLVLVVAALLLGAGWVARGHFRDATTTWEGGGIRLAHPRGWVASRAPAGEKGVSLDATITDLWSAGIVKPEVRVRVEADPTGGLMPVDYVALDLAHRLPLFHQLGRREIKLGDAPATRLEFAWAADPTPAVEVSEMPVVMRGVALVLPRGADLVTVTIAAPASEYGARPAKLEAIAASVTPQGRPR